MSQETFTNYWSIMKKTDLSLIVTDEQVNNIYFSLLENEDIISDKDLQSNVFRNVNRLTSKQLHSIEARLALLLAQSDLNEHVSHFIENAIIDTIGPLEEITFESNNNMKLVT